MMFKNKSIKKNYSKKINTTIITLQDLPTTWSNSALLICVSLMLTVSSCLTSPRRKPSWENIKTTTKKVSSHVHITSDVITFCVIAQVCPFVKTVRGATTLSGPSQLRVVFKKRQINGGFKSSLYTLRTTSTSKTFFTIATEASL